LSTPSRQARILYYVQHLLGIGHLMRSVRICEALKNEGVQVTIVSGGMPVQGFPPEGIDHIALPSIAVRDGDFSTIVDVNDREIDDAFRSVRRERLLEIYDELTPDLVVLEAFPFGRRQLRFELIPLLEKIEASSAKPVVVSSVRDILQKRTKPGRDDDVLQLINQHFDKILVHGDPRFFRLEETFPKASEINDKVIYSGLVCAKSSKDVAENFDVVVSAGGGAVGAELVEVAIAAAKLLPETVSWCVITGPNSPINEDLEEMSTLSPNIKFEKFRSDFPSLLKSATLSVSQAGYNTVSDILSARCHCLLVPYSASGESEQLDRANRLAALGIATVLHQENLSAENMASMINELLNTASPTVDISLDTNGAEQSAKALLELIKRNATTA